MRTLTNIPVLLCEYFLKNQKITQFKLYLYLKLSSDGYVVYDSNRFKEWAQIIGVDVKTVRSSFNFLVKNRWITINGKRNVLHIIGYKRLAIKLGIDLRTGYLCELEDFANLKALCCAIVITRYLYRKRFFDRRQSECINGRSNTNCTKRSGFYPMANSYLTKCIGVSIATACRYKQLAEKFGYIDTKENFSTFCEVRGESLAKENFKVVQKGWLGEGRPNVIRKGEKYVLMVEADLIRSNLNLKKKFYLPKGKN